MHDWVLPSGLALAIFVAACIAGQGFRSVWRAEGPLWQLWFFGLCAAIGLLVLAIVPLASS